MADKHDMYSLHDTLVVLGKQVESYRLSRLIKQDELAKMAGISRSTLARMESGKGGTLDTLARVLKALDLNDRIFTLLPKADISPFDMLRATGKKRQRVSGTQASSESFTGRRPKPWQWGN